MDDKTIKLAAEKPLSHKDKLQHKLYCSYYVTTVYCFTLTIPGQYQYFYKNSMPLCLLRRDPCLQLDDSQNHPPPTNEQVSTDT